MTIALSFSFPQSVMGMTQRLTTPPYNYTNSITRCDMSAVCIACGEVRNMYWQCDILLTVYNVMSVENTPDSWDMQS